jgi:rhomboid protease GluP
MPSPAAMPVPVARTPRPKAAREYALVLAAAGIGCEVLEDPSGHLVAVDPADAARASSEIALYEEENRGWRRPEELPLALGESWFAVVLWTLLLSISYAFSLTSGLGLRLWSGGRLAADEVRHGAIWRTVTSLGLHVDPVHLLGNLLFGALFVALAAEMLGTGVGLLAVIVTGAIANYGNAWIQQPGFSAVGASTAVFAALGLLGGHRWQQRHVVRRLRRSSWIPLIASAFLLAYLGSGSGPEPRLERIDVAGHALGFAVGVVAGAAYARLARNARPGPRAQAAVGTLAVLLWIACWSLALR